MISQGKRLLGVADGVGGWATKDVCSGKCSKFLCRKIGEFFKSDNSRNLKDMLLDGVKELQKEEIEGSTTMVLAKLEPDSTADVNMRALNLGDSGYMIVRPNADQTLTKVHRSEE